MTTQLALRDASRRCPKRMIYGPCGGVRAGGGCELPGLPCSFVEAAAALDSLAFHEADIAAPAAARDSGDVLGTLPRRPAADAFALRVRAGGVITADLPVRGADTAVLAEAGARLSGLTAVIAGEPPGLRDALSPTHKALVLGGAGATVIVGVTCRDRNRVALEGELAALADLGAPGILAVTGDHPASTALPAAEPVFDLDSTRLAALGRRAGLFVAVAEQPAAPPVSFRAERLAMKARAGAELGILNLCGGTREVAAFAAAVRAAAGDTAGGGAIPLLAPIPIITSAHAAARLGALPAVTLPPGLAEAIAASGDPLRAGIRAAVAGALAALAVPGIAGVHLSAIGDDDADPTGLSAVGALAQTAALIREAAA